MSHDYNIHPGSLAPWVIVSAGFHSQGGQAKAVAALAEHLAERGHAVHLVGHDFDPALANTKGVTIYAQRRPGNVDSLGNVFLSRAGYQVAARVKAARPDTRVVVNGGNCPWSDINWIHYLHGAWHPDLRSAPVWFRVKEQFIGRLNRRRKARVIRAARLVITNSRRTRDDVLQAVPGVRPDRVLPIYYGADPRWSPADDQQRRDARVEFAFPADKPLVAFVGGLGLDNRKGFDTLLAAWVQLCRRRDWDADLLLAGGGKATASLAQQVAQAGVANRVRLLGFTDRIFQLLAAVDLLVSPVRYEPYGLNVQEAICRGLPALVTACAGVAEQYQPQQLEMVLPNPDDADDLARRLLLSRADPQGWRQKFQPLSQQLRARTWEQMSQDILAAAESMDRTVNHPAPLPSAAR